MESQNTGLPPFRRFETRYANSLGDQTLCGPKHKHWTCDTAPGGTVDQVMLDIGAIGGAVVLDHRMAYGSLSECVAICDYGGGMQFVDPTGHLFEGGV